MHVISRRSFLAATSAAAFGLASPAVARNVLRIPRDWLPTDVKVTSSLPAGTIYVDTPGMWLFLMQDDGMARRYKTSVGAEGRNLIGQARVARKEVNPPWTPTANMIAAEPKVYAKFRDGLPGGDPINPLGVRALYLYQGNRDTYTRIHGTPWPQFIGTAFSSGCVRLMNEHVIDLYDRVPIGTKVVLA
jgi:lipoprotein-anchoring transpeptidase ErfK/SrfK